MADTVLIAKRLASARTAQPPGAIEVLAAEEVTWGDSSLGCPSPGRNYMQVLTPGYLIRLRAGEATLQMHADRRGSVLACPPERAERPAPDGAVR